MVVVVSARRFFDFLPMDLFRFGLQGSRFDFIFNIFFLQLFKYISFARGVMFFDNIKIDIKMSKYEREENRERIFLCDRCCCIIQQKVERIHFKLVTLFFLIRQKKLQAMAL